MNTADWKTNNRGNLTVCITKSFVRILAPISLAVLPLSACASMPAGPVVSDLGHDRAIVTTDSSCVLYGPTADLGFHAGNCTDPADGIHMIRLEHLASDLEYHARPYKPGDTVEGARKAIRFRTLPAFVCGDGRCDRDRGENALLCPSDCRMDRCENTFGAYGFSVARDSDIPEIAHRAGVRFSIGYTYPLQQMEISGTDPLRVIQMDVEGKRIAVERLPGGAPYGTRRLAYPAKFTIDGREYQCASTARWDAGGNQQFGGFTDCVFPEGAGPSGIIAMPIKQYEFGAMVQLNSRFVNRFQLREAMGLPEIMPGSDEIKVCSVQRKLKADDPGNCQFLKHSPIEGFPAVFSVEWEEVSCKAFDAVESKFTGCTRGANHTLTNVHPPRTFLLDHMALEKYLTSLSKQSKMGYYVQDDPIDDSRLPEQPKSNYLPLLQKMYQIIKKSDAVNPVFAGFPTLGLYMYPWKVTVPNNIGPGAFDAAILYVYPGMRNIQDPSIRKDSGIDYNDTGFEALLSPSDTTKAVTGRYMQVFENILGHRPPFIGVIRIFRMAPQWPDNPKSDEIRRQIDDFLDSGASAIAAYTLHSENPVNITPTSPPDIQNRKSDDHHVKETSSAKETGPELLNLLSHGAGYSTSRLCGRSVMNPPRVELSSDHKVVKYSVSGSFNRLDCAISIDGAEFRVDTAISNSEKRVVVLPRYPDDSVGVRCWSGSLQNSSYIGLDSVR